MANVMFKRGAQSDLAKYLSTGGSQAIDGAFYLTSDTNRLYVGKDLGSGNIKAVPVNQGVITVESGVETEKAESALEAIRNELDEVRKGNFSDETIQNAKLSFRDALKNVYDSTSAIAEWLMGYTLSSVFYTPEELSQLINEVSREEIIVAANMVSEDTVYLLQAEKEEN